MSRTPPPGNVPADVERGTVVLEEKMLVGPYPASAAAALLELFAGRLPP
jgi:hypothetical protein